MNARRLAMQRTRQLAPGFQQHTVAQQQLAGLLPAQGEDGQRLCGEVLCSTPSPGISSQT